MCREQAVEAPEELAEEAHQRFAQGKPTACVLPQISSMGRFRTKYGKVYFPKPRKTGYCSVVVNGRNLLVHRLVAAAFLPPMVGADQTDVDHIDGTKDYNRTVNLRRASHGENMNNKNTKKHRKSTGPKMSKPVKARRVGESTWSLRFESSIDAAKKLRLHQGAM